MRTMSAEENSFSLLEMTFTKDSFESMPVTNAAMDFWKELSASSPETDKPDENEIISRYPSNMEFDRLVASIMGDDQVPKEFNVEHLRYYTKGFGKIISEGGFGEVFKGWIVGPNGDVIYKLAIKRSHDSSERYMTEWQKEKDYLSTIHHPNIIKLIGYAHDERLYLVYEFMEHGSVSRSLKGLDWTQTKHIAMGSARAIQHLHVQNPCLIFRDFKAANILLDQNNNPKLSDFGAVTEEKKKEYRGTLGCTDPEAITLGHSTKERDVYSMGILLLQLITKRRKKPWLIKENVISRFGIQNLSVVHESLKDGGCSDHDDKKITVLALRCLDDDITRRPTIQEVIEQLGQLNGNY